MMFHQPGEPDTISFLRRAFFTITRAPQVPSKIVLRARAHASKPAAAAIAACDSRLRLVAISFGQCLRDTVESLLRAKRQGMPTFGITDSDTTPIARHADAHLVALVATPTFLNSYVAPMAAITAIHVACAHVGPKGSLTRLRPTDREYVSGTRWYREPKSNSHK